MSDSSYLSGPFFEPRHADRARALDAWASERIVYGHGVDVDAECRALVRMLGAAGEGFKTDFQPTQAKLARMATAIDSAVLLTYRAASQRDQGRGVTREAAMAKMTTTENAQAVIDDAIQIWGGLGVVSGPPVERPYREVSSLRIYEGATEVPQLIIARDSLRDATAVATP